MPQQAQGLPSFDELMAKYPPEPPPPTPPPQAPRSDDRSASQVAFDQAKQVPLGLAGMAASMSPLRFQQGWTHPTLGIPEAVAGAATMAGHALTGNAQGLQNDLGALLHPYATLGREAAATADAFQVPGFQGSPTPSQADMEQATRGATQNAATLAMADMGPMGRRAQGAATVAGKPAAMVRAGTLADEAQGALPSWAKHPLTAVAGPALRAGGKALYDVTQDPKAQVPYVGEYTPPPGPSTSGINSPVPEPPPLRGGSFTMKKAPSSTTSIREVPRPSPPPTGGPRQGLPEGPTPPKQLAAAPKTIDSSLAHGTFTDERLAGDTGMSIQDLRQKGLIQREADGNWSLTDKGRSQLTSPQSQFKGQEGGLGPQPHQDVVAQRPMVVRTIAGDGSGGVPGRMRLETVNEMKARLANFGRGVTKQPTAEAEPLKLPKPTPPKKATP